MSLSFSVQNRFGAFTECCRNEGIEPQVIVCKVDDAGRYQISDVVTQLMSLPKLPTAIACQETALLCRSCSSWSATVSPCRAMYRLSL